MRTIPALGNVTVYRVSSTILIAFANRIAERILNEIGRREILTKFSRKRRNVRSKLNAPKFCEHVNFAWANLGSAYDTRRKHYARVCKARRLSGTSWPEDSRWSSTYQPLHRIWRHAECRPSSCKRLVEWSASQNYLESSLTSCEPSRPIAVSEPVPLILPARAGARQPRTCLYRFRRSEGTLKLIGRTAL